MTEKRRVIIITDGDTLAKNAVEVAARNIGARCISSSAGNPTKLSGREIVKRILQTPYDPVVVMVDDRGWRGEGAGERALRQIAAHPNIEVLGVLAVASNTEGLESIDVNESITSTCRVVDGPVDKDGHRCSKEYGLRGDTVEILRDLDIPVVIGIGDVGKMHGADDAVFGSPVTTKALQEVLERSGYYGNGRSN
ncbi:stage V sporulation protein AE [Peptococcaceae bacterium 1198_IL3148]